ncbi:nuclear transport factor 2 family protein [Bradyrhizobium forestalis]|uniref:nuclear transport factor 2 family protein n=1 Tax=Bradyrhizobium forestalis TaxID=1419263 RepID=UPI0011AF144D
MSSCFLAAASAGIGHGRDVSPWPARLTMVLVKEGNDWVIAHHHSSLRPPPKQ